MEAELLAHYCPSRQHLHFLQVAFASYALSWAAALLLQLLPKTWRKTAHRWAAGCLLRWRRGRRDCLRFLLLLEVTLNSALLFAFIVEDHLYQLFENCLPLAENAFQMVDLALNVCFLGPFLLRMALAENVRKFLSSCYTIADYCTIPPAIFGVIIGRSFVGLQFMRSIFLLKVPEIGGSVEISRGFLIRKSLSKVLTVWFLMAGLMHLNEGLGDSTSLEEPHELTYGTWLYFTVVTLTTVGYGDITCKTTLCRCYLIISIVFTLVLYATYIPELVMRIGKLETNVMPYVPILARRHIVFCGFLDPQKIRSFVTRWIDRGVDLVFLGELLRVSATPGRVYVPVGHDCFPLGPPAAPRASTVLPRTARHRESMSGHKDDGGKT
ncbi:calcium-activated potassium channel slowpoke-like [Penaeus indicus]|uniref:calcium-activated potassium channel slowpoke-like n=1 Tax=Penaeus indicus TaxID=29960 RepID=UPI00300C495D